MNTCMAVILTADGNASIRRITPDGDTLRGHVGGWLEGVYLSHGVHAYVDEEGKLKGAPVNETATHLLTQLGWSGTLGGDFLVGTVVMLGDDDPGEGSVPEEVLGVVRAFYAARPDLTLVDHAEPNPAKPQDQRFDADGWQYGVRFHDGSVEARWSGPTQRDHASDLAEIVNGDERHEQFYATVVRHRDQGDWEVVEEPDDDWRDGGGWHDTTADNLNTSGSIGFSVFEE